MPRLTKKLKQTETERLAELLKCPACGGPCHYTRRWLICIGNDCQPRALAAGNLDVLLKLFPDSATSSRANNVEGK